MAKLRFDNENEAAWPDEDSATCQSLIEKGRALGVNFKSGTTPTGQKTFLRGLSTVNRTLILDDSIITFEFRFWP